MILKILLVIIGVFLGLVGSGFCQSAKARDTITMTLEDYKHGRNITQFADKRTSQKP